MKSDVLTLIAGQARSRPSLRAGSRSRSRQQHRQLQQPQTLDELMVILRDMLQDRQLEVSKVRPFFWTLVESYTDRFHSYPFNTFKALYSDLEMRGFPPDEVERIVTHLEHACEEHHGRPMQRTPLDPGDYEMLDEEIRDLKDSLCYASLVSGSDETED